MTDKQPSVAKYLLLILLISVCSPAADLHVAAAANLSTVLPDLSAAFERQTGNHVVASFGATAQLTQQIENGAPFDVFLAADVEHIDQLIKSRFVIPGTHCNCLPQPARCLGCRR